MLQRGRVPKSAEMGLQRAILHLAAELQRGRVPKSPEIYRGWFVMKLSLLLQRGRVPKSAEITNLTNSSATPLAASTGPRSEERGNRRVSPGGIEIRRASTGPRSEERGNG